MLRESMDRDGVAVLHLGFSVEGVVFELVGAKARMAGLDAEAWPTTNAPPAHALPESSPSTRPSSTRPTTATTTSPSTPMSPCSPFCWA